MLARLLEETRAGKTKIAMKATPQQIDAFLKLFDDDPRAAVQAIREHNTEAITAKRPARPLADKIIISVAELTKEYQVGRQKVHALNGVSFDVHEGEFVAITAPSGSGKSTLLQLVGGLEKPTNGRVFVNGVDINQLSDHKLSQFRGQTIGFIFQFFYLQPFLDLERNMEVPGMFARTNRHERRKRVYELAQTVGIADRLKHLPKELSGGQTQRAAIARALLNNPKVILADEPTGNLDSKNGAGIIDLFEKIRDEFGATIIVATHDPAVAGRADRIIKLQDGVLA
jgi:putative ABC transport system ATP-binding protein